MIPKHSQGWKPQHLFPGVIFLNSPFRSHCTCHLSCVKIILQYSITLKWWFIYSNEDNKQHPNVLRSSFPQGPQGPCWKPGGCPRAVGRQLGTWETVIGSVQARSGSALEAERREPSECSMIIKLFVLLKESNYRHVKKGKHSPRTSSSHASQEAPGPLKIPWWRGKTAWEQPGGNTAN